MRRASFIRLVLVGVLTATAWSPVRLAEETAPESPRVEIAIKGTSGEGGKLTAPLKILFMMTALSLAPALLILMTSFTRIVIVLSFVRHALATQQIPPNLVLTGMALFLTAFIMAPIWKEMHDEAFMPYTQGQLNEMEALERGLKPLREFMGKQTRKKDLKLFVELSNSPAPETFEDIPTTVLVPAFVISELRTAFQMGFLVFLPFIIVDLVVGTVLMSLGMVMLPPAMVALPLKLLLFVLADGWRLVIQSLVVSFHAG